MTTLGPPHDESPPEVDELDVDDADDAYTDRASSCDDDVEAERSAGDDDQHVADDDVEDIVLDDLIAMEGPDA
jgi:hypothetical protein